MSEYFRVLKRIESEHAQPREIPAVAAKPEPKPLRPVPPVPRPAALPAAAISVSGHAPGAFATLFENLRVLAKDRMTPCFVLAGAGAGETVRAITGGLRGHGERIGAGVIIAELCDDHGERALTPRTGSRDGAREALPLNLHDPDWPEGLAAWVGRNGEPGGFVLVEAPSLADSVSGALLARNCDGLVLVVETEATARKALRDAVARAQAAGCPPLGLVMHGTRDYVPAWFHRLAATALGSIRAGRSS